MPNPHPIVSPLTAKARALHAFGLPNGQMIGEGQPLAPHAGEGWLTEAWITDQIRFGRVTLEPPPSAAPEQQEQSPASDATVASEPAAPPAQAPAGGAKTAKGNGKSKKTKAQPVSDAAGS